MAKENLVKEEYEMEQYRVVIKETPKSKSVIYENITYSEMLEYYVKYQKGATEKVYQLKIYKRKDENSFWAVEVIFEYGEIIQAYDLKKKDKPKVERLQTEPFDFNKFMKEFSVDSVPASRRNDMVSLFWDWATGEDITKPKLSVLDGDKEYN